uniref:EGF-like domain-containing protein n=1 Tax=Biomphalaria glabrata TaxID=6526 RepID=A0A2C9LP54_BIOGL
MCQCESGWKCDSVNGSCYNNLVSTTQTTTASQSCSSATCNTNKHELCVDKTSGYECVCKSGFMRANTNLECTEISSYNYTLTFGWDMSNVNLDKDSEDHKKVKDECETQMTKSLKEKKVDVVLFSITNLRFHFHLFV